MNTRKLKQRNISRNCSENLGKMIFHIACKLDFFKLWNETKLELWIRWNNTKTSPKNHIQPKEDMNNQNLQITWSIKKLTPRFSDIDMKIWKFIRSNSFLIRGKTFILFPFSLHQPPSRGEHNSLVLNRDEHLTLAFCFKNSVHNEITAIAFIIIQK